MLKSARALLPFVLDISQAMKRYLEGYLEGYQGTPQLRPEEELTSCHWIASKLTAWEKTALRRRRRTKCWAIKHTLDIPLRYNGILGEETGGEF